MGAQQGIRGGKPPLNLLVVLLILVALFVGPRVLDAYAAFQWTCYYASRGAAPPRAAENARQAGRAAARAIDLGAPLPVAAHSARLALDLGRNLEAAHPEAASEIYNDVRGALDQAAAQPVRGWGLAGLAQEAAELQARAQAAQRSRTP